MKEQLITIGALLKRNRDAKGYTLDDIYLLYGLNKRTVMKLEKGEGGNIESLLRYVKAFNLSTWVLPESLRKTYESTNY